MTDEALSADAGNGADGASAAALLTPPAAAADPKPAAASGDVKPAIEAGSWLEGITDPAERDFAQNKGWKNPAELLSGYKNLEKLLGGDKVPLPKGEDDKEGLDRVYKALGRPDEPGGYKLGERKGADPAFTKEAEGWFHEAGLSPRQAALLADKWDGAQAAETAKLQAEFKAASQKDMADLQTEWGGEFEAKTEQARRAARQFGVDRQAMEGIEAAMGTRKMMEFFSKVGGSIGEDTFVEGEGGTKGFGMSVEQATARIAALKGDKAWTGRYLSGGADEKSEMERLIKITSGGQ